MKTSQARSDSHFNKVIGSNSVGKVETGKTIVQLKAEIESKATVYWDTSFWSQIDPVKGEFNIFSNQIVYIVEGGEVWSWIGLHNK